MFDLVSVPYSADPDPHSTTCAAVNKRPLLYNRPSDRGSIFSADEVKEGTQINSFIIFAYDCANFPIGCNIRHKCLLMLSRWR